ncbi:tyrosine-type recombinase/integrase (plasmid) [Methylomarinum sp. Ch1-1]|uniref:Tyrosine-type recombinase/integrase n=1 Tax=Methylomarinum roseum TaxID=3067653 RepID=A0AAU7NNY2_9GAMM|nr:tyrosine-type recombinase/integrase [Methylomarinum sp. Ch1-1]MDP4523114.1 site-specific integrase [Methylomarinum sp. Ch1-1]
MANSIELKFEKTKKEFLKFLKYTKGHAETTCYNYNSDLNIWIAWLTEEKLDWRKCQPTDAEHFVSFLAKANVGAHAIARKISCQATFYKWAKRNDHVQEDPIYQIEKPKRPRRMPVWMEAEEQEAFMKAIRNYDDIPDNIYGRSKQSAIKIRQRYELLFELIQKSGLRISEALGLKVSDVRVVDGVAKSVRVIGKGNKERQVPLPESFGRVLAVSIADKYRDEYLFAKKPGGRPIGQHAARAYWGQLTKRKKSYAKECREWLLVIHRVAICRKAIAISHDYPKVIVNLFITLSL